MRRRRRRRWWLRRRLANDSGAPAELHFCETWCVCGVSSQCRCRAQLSASFVRATLVRCVPPPPLQAGLRDSAGGAQGRGGAHEGRHARGWRHPNPWRQRLRATPSGDELSRPSSRRDPPGGGAGRAAEGGQVASQGSADRRALPYYNSCRSDGWRQHPRRVRRLWQRRRGPRRWSGR